jgi:hypothetical protein
MRKQLMEAITGSASGSLAKLATANTCMWRGSRRRRSLKHHTRRYGHSLLRCYGLSERLDATFHGVVNFAFTEFSEV